MLQKDLTRRTVVTGALGAAALAVTGLGRAAHACSGPLCCTGAVTWAASGYKAGTDVVVTKAVVLDTSVSVGNLTIKPGGSIVFDPAKSVTLTVSGNLVVEGLLRAAPASPVQVHRVVIAGAVESGFVGGGMVPLATDRGLWVLGNGRLELQGAERTPWVRLAGGAEVGQRTLTLAAVPTGWLAGDEVTVAPTASPWSKNPFDQYDTARIVSVTGASVLLDRPLVFAHPAVPVAPGLVATAEVLNLTRNVQVEGTSTGRAHVWITGAGKQVLEYAAVRHMGPRQADGRYTKHVLGRYGLHLHMQGEASRGTEVVGMVVRDTGSHAFVPHLSHGVRFTGCISHNTFDEAFWYDPVPQGGVEVEDLVYESCVASRVQTDPPFRGYRLMGFWLANGIRNSIRNCVAVGVQGNKEAAGFGWPESGGGVWDFRDNVSHNNKTNGSFTWQNSKLPHVVTRMVAYHNQGAGISHGAYRNFYVYEDCILYGNVEGGVRLHALGERQPLVFRRLHIDQAGYSQHAVDVTKHSLAAINPVVFSDCTIKGYGTSGFGFNYTGANGVSENELLDIVECEFSGTELTMANGLLPGSRVRVQRDGVARLARPLGAPEAGSVVPAWNAKVEPIAPFAVSTGTRQQAVLVPGAVSRPRTSLPHCPAPVAGAPSSMLRGKKPPHAHPKGTAAHKH